MKFVLFEKLAELSGKELIMFIAAAVVAVALIVLLVSLRKRSAYTIREICNLHRIRTCCNIHSIHIHLIHKTHNKGHCDVVKCCFKRRRKTNLNNLRKYLS